MGFRFRKSISLFPGVRLNLSKGGISTSIGRPGATINVGKRGVRGTVGLPGSGLSYSDMLFSRRRRSQADDAYDGSTDGVAGFPIRKAVVVAMVAVLAVVALLFFSGLQSARQTEPAVGFRPSSSSVAAVTAERPDVRRSEDGSGATARVAEGVNCRANPNARAKIVSVLSGSEDLTIIDTQAGWSRVTTDDLDCWVSSRLVE